MVHAAATPRGSFRDIEERYFVEFLKRNPVAATYLGGDAYAPSLAATAGSLRDYDDTALDRERKSYLDILTGLDALPAGSLRPDEAIDAAVMRAQIQFMNRQTGERKYHRRCLDTYMTEPFRGVDWQIQGMTDVGEGRYGTEEEWHRVIERVRRIPSYLDVAQTNLRQGAAEGQAPDSRVLVQDGLKTSEANAIYFQETLPALAGSYTKGQRWSEAITRDIAAAGAEAAAAQRRFRAFVIGAYFVTGDGQPSLQERWRGDRYAMGEEEYNWALSNNLRETRSARELFETSSGAVADTTRQLMEVARRVDADKGWSLRWETPEAARVSTRVVMSRLGDDHPKDDAEMIAWYKKKSFELVDYGRQYHLFDIPADYKLDVIETPPVLRQGLDGAAYYPAPPFKRTGVGRFYVSPTGNDDAHLRENNRASMADLCAHEGFPGHDWHYQFLRGITASIGKVRWLTPGAVEDSSSMWVDSMMTEGWALYAEQLMAEPQPGAPDGVYSAAERLYQLQGQLLRDARVRIDTGIHTGRMTFDEAVDYYTANVDFLPGACSGKTGDAEARASCETARKAVLRYSKWPTQAITYSLGKRSILDLRREVKQIQGARFDLKAFHEKVLSVGTIPLAYARDQILEWALSGK